MSDITSALQNGVVFVTFRKKDSSVREMICTQQPSRINYVNKSNSERKRNDDVLVVWDMSKLEWRSMRKDSVLSWNDVTSSY